MLLDVAFLLVLPMVLRLGNHPGFGDSDKIFSGLAEPMNLLNHFINNLFDNIP